MSETFEQWAMRTLGPEVMGVTDWSIYHDCWHASRKAAIDAAEQSYDEYWEREYANYNIEGSDRGFGETVWKAARGLQ